MTICAVSTVFNEADIIRTTVTHLYGEGVDHIYIACAPSPDGTRDILEDLRDESPKGTFHVYDDTDQFHFQPRWMNRLAALAACGSDAWIVPFDADEFFYPTEGGTIRGALLALPGDVQKLRVRSFQHRDWEHREVAYRSLGKVAFRWAPGAFLTNGSHDVSVSGVGTGGVLDLRELQFRSFEHLCRKSHERVARLDPSLPVTDGIHQRQIDAMDLEHKKQKWRELQALPVVYDPVPSTLSGVL